MRRVWTTLTAAAPGRAAELTRLDAVVRSPLPLSTRVGFLGVAGGTGCSTAAGLAAAVLTSRRGRRMLAVNASASRRSLLWHAGLVVDARVDRMRDAERAAARRADQATAGLARAPGGLYCMDLVSEPGEGVDAAWWESVAPIGRFFDFVVTDWGVRDADSAGDVASSSAVVCVVTTADRTGLQRGVDLAHAVSAAGTPSLLAVVDAHRRRTAAVGEAVRLLPLGAVEVPHDSAHGAAAPVPSSRLRAATNLAATRLAAALVRAATPARPVPADRAGEPGSGREGAAA